MISLQEQSTSIKKQTKHQSLLQSVSISMIPTKVFIQNDYNLNSNNKFIDKMGVSLIEVNLLLLNAAFVILISIKMLNLHITTQLVFIQLLLFVCNNTQYKVYQFRQNWYYKRKYKQTDEIETVSWVSEFCWWWWWWWWLT